MQSFHFSLRAMRASLTLTKWQELLALCTTAQVPHDDIVLVIDVPSDVY